MAYKTTEKLPDTENRQNLDTNRIQFQQIHKNL